jgi:hypothetical protein
VPYKLVGFQQAALPQEALSSKYGIPFNVLLYWMKVCWLYERPLKKKITFVIQKKNSNLLRIHCGYLKIETIVPLSFF